MRGRHMFRGLHLNPASQLEYLVNNSDSRFLFVENDEQLDKFLQVRSNIPGLTKVIILDRVCTGSQTRKSYS